MTENPFFEAWNTPFELPPFDRIRPEHFPPGLRPRHGGAHRRDRRASPAPPTRPISPIRSRRLERSGRLLDRVSRVFYNLDFERDQRRRSKRSPGTTRQSSRSTSSGSRSIPDLFARIDTLCAGAATGSGSRPTSCGFSSAIISASCAPAHCSTRRRRRAWPRFPSAWRACTPCSAKTCCTTNDDWRLVLDEGGPRGPARFRPRRGGRGGQGARPRRPLRDHLVARLGRAVSDLLGPPRSAPNGRARPGRRAARIPANTTTRPLIRRDHGVAGRAGAASRLSTVSPTTASTTRWRRPRTAAERLLLAGLGAGQAQGRARSARRWRRWPAPRVSTSRSRPGIGAITPRRCGRRNTTLDEAEVKPYFVLDNMVAGGVRHGRPAVRPDALSSARTARSITRMCGPMRCATRAGRPRSAFFCTTISPGPASTPAPGSSRYRDQESLDGDGAADRRQQQQFRSKGDPTARSASTTRGRCSTNSATGCTVC